MKNYLKKILIIAFISFKINAQESIIIQEGKTYSFAEENILDLLKKRIQEAKQELINKQDDIQSQIKKQIKNYRPPNLAELEPAIKDDVFLVDMTYVLENDIKNAAGGILYKKGYTFNPLDYINLDSKYIIINADNQKELEWFRKSKFYNNYEYKVLLSGGSYYDLTKELNRQVYYLPKEMKERMQIKHTVSLISQENKYIKIIEICIQCKRD